MLRALPVGTTGLLTGMTVLLLLAAAPADAQEGDDGPRVTFQNLQDGDVLAEPPSVIQLCFSEPVSVKDPIDGGDYSFSLKTPEGLGVGRRTVFQPNGFGVAVFAGDPPALPSGFPTADDPIWTFEWRVTAADDLTPVEGTITFTVDEDADMNPRETLPACVESLFTTPSNAGDRDDEDNVSQGEDDDGTDILLIVLLAAGAIAIASLGVIGLTRLLRLRRVRNEGPTPESEKTPPDDHPRTNSE